VLTGVLCHTKTRRCTPGSPPPHHAYLPPFSPLALHLKVGEAWAGRRSSPSGLPLLLASGCVLDVHRLQVEERQVGAGPLLSLSLRMSLLLLLSLSLSLLLLQSGGAPGGWGPLLSAVTETVTATVTVIVTITALTASGGAPGGWGPLLSLSLRLSLLLLLSLSLSLLLLQVEERQVCGGRPPSSPHSSPRSCSSLGAPPSSTLPLPPHTILPPVPPCHTLLPPL